jgi:hypothetical protein
LPTTVTSSGSSSSYESDHGEATPERIDMYLSESQPSARR